MSSAALAGEARRRRGGKMAAMIRGFCQAHDDDPTLFRFLLFVQHGQLAKLGRARRRRSTPCATVIVAGMRAGEMPDQDADLATALVLGVVLQPVTFCGLRPAARDARADRRAAGRRGVERRRHGVSGLACTETRHVAPHSVRCSTSRRFAPLFVTQFLGAFNDNLLKSALGIFVTVPPAPKQTGADAGARW